MSSRPLATCRSRWTAWTAGATGAPRAQRRWPKTASEAQPTRHPACPQAEALEMAQWHRPRSRSAHTDSPVATARALCCSKLSQPSCAAPRLPPRIRGLADAGHAGPRAREVAGQARPVPATSRVPWTSSAEERAPSWPGPRSQRAASSPGSASPRHLPTRHTRSGLSPASAAASCLGFRQRLRCRPCNRRLGSPFAQPLAPVGKRPRGAALAAMPQHGALSRGRGEKHHP